MTGSTWRRLGGVAALALVLVIEGCAGTRPHRGGFNCDRRWGAGTGVGAFTGGLVGAGVGTGIVATSGETERQAEDYATAAVIGAVTGSLIGAFFGHCAFDPPHDEEPPPPPPPAPPPPPPPPVKKKIVLRGVNFDFDKWTIRRDASDILVEAANILRDEPGVDVSVDGHTDARGTDEYNDRLSERRARTVRDHLVRLGVEESRLRTQGFGESRPVATNETEEGRAQNRRVELNVVR
jgi:OmpA-OmpF porin, OOP family